MGTQLGSIIIAREISLKDISGKKLAVDTYNILYQFVSTIRQQDGSLLTDSKGNVTSHLSGLFFRTTSLMKNNIRLAFVFDGTAPELKKEERERRQELKKEAMTKYRAAADEGDVELMKKYASRTSQLTGEMVEESKELISALGLPVIEAPSEGEAQAAELVKSNGFYAMISQDTDGLLFGCPKIIKNLSISRKRKKAGSSAYEAVSPELVDLSENLNNLMIDREQLIVVGMLCGTDFNIGGIKGIGPKKALDLVRKHGKDFSRLFEEVRWGEHFNYPWEKVYETIHGMPAKKDTNLAWGQIDRKKVIEILVERHEFSEERVMKAIEELSKTQSQRGLGDFF